MPTQYYNEPSIQSSEIIKLVQVVKRISSMRRIKSISFFPSAIEGISIFCAKENLNKERFSGAF